MDAKAKYREAAVRGAGPVQLVILLYEQSIENLRRAVVALERNDVEGRTREINHALKVIGHLQCSLDMEQGGAVAQNLARFYSNLRTCLIEAHTQQSTKMLEAQISHLLLVREAWAEVERGYASDAKAISRRARGDAARPVGDWRA
jgi:flagellar protein FliS